MSDWTQIQSPTNTAGAANASVTMSPAPVNGRLMIAVVGAGSLSAVTAMTASGVAWSTAQQLDESGASISIFYKICGASESTTQSTNIASPSNVDLIVYEYAGNGTGLDVAAAGVDSGSAVFSESCGTTAALASNGELGVAAVRLGGAATAPSFDHGFTMDVNINRTVSGLLEGISGVAAQTTTLTWTTTGRRASGILAIFKMDPKIGAWLPLTSQPVFERVSTVSY